MSITHRVVEVLHTDEGLRFRTKGDNNQTADGALVIPENVLGKTLLRIPMLGRVQFLLASKGGLLIFILIPAVGIIVYDIIKLFRVKDVSDKVEEVIQDKPEDKVLEEQKMIEENRKQELIEKLNKEKNQKKIEFEFVPIEEKNIETNKHQEENNNIVFDDDEIEQEITDIDFEDDEDDF